MDGAEGSLFLTLLVRTSGALYCHLEVAKGPGVADGALCSQREVGRGRQGAPWKGSSQDCFLWAAGPRGARGQPWGPVTLQY